MSASSSASATQRHNSDASDTDAMPNVFQEMKTNIERIVSHIIFVSNDQITAADIQKTSKSSATNRNDVDVATALAMVLPDLEQTMRDIVKSLSEQQEDSTVVWDNNTGRFEPELNMAQLKQYRDILEKGTPGLIFLFLSAAKYSIHVTQGSLLQRVR